MSQDDEPTRLLTSGGSDIERRLVDAIAHERPSPELRRRMAQVIGVPLGTLAATETLDVAKEGAKSAQTLQAPTAAATSGSGPLVSLPLISAGVLGLIVAGVIVGTYAWRMSPHPAARVAVPSPPSIPAVPSPPGPVEVAPAPVTTAREKDVPVAPTLRRGRTRALTADLHDQIVLIDGARAAVSASADDRALELLRQYQDKYPTGTFRPEAAALTVEVLARLGRTAEARALATRFRAEYGENPQTDRVRRLAGGP